MGLVSAFNAFLGIKVCLSIDYLNFKHQVHTCATYFSSAWLVYQPECDDR